MLNMIFCEEKNRDLVWTGLGCAHTHTHTYIYIGIKVRKMKDGYVYVLTPSLLTQTKTDLLPDDPLHEKTSVKKVFMQCLLPWK